MEFITFYLGMVGVTWCYGGFATGRQFYKTVKDNPKTSVSVNWMNILYQGLVWPAFWASELGSFYESRMR